MGKLETKEADLINKAEAKILARNEKVHGGWVSCDALVPAVMLNSKVQYALIKI
jgi:hypothetical protein